MKIIPIFLIASLLLLPSLAAERVEDFEKLCADRTAIERVYHAHRLGTKPAFEEVMPPALIGQIIRQDQQKEAALSKMYGVEITPAMIAAETERINTTTRAPEVLAEIRHALGDDAARFARAMAHPIIVERELRRHFDNDHHLHAAKRHEAEQARENLLAKNPVPEMHATTWQLTPRSLSEPAGSSASPAPLLSSSSTASSSAYTNAATAQFAQPLTPREGTGPDKDRHYFEDLGPELQKVLRVQLQKPGDVSAVIETPVGFLVFQAREKSPETLTAATFSTPKRSYEDWLAQQKQ